MKDFNEKVYVIDTDYNIQEMTFEEYLQEFCNELVTSPRGAEPKFFIDHQCDDEDDEEWFNVCQWTAAKKIYVIESFETQVEAKEKLLNILYGIATEGRKDVPGFFVDEKQAEDHLKILEDD